MATHEIKPYANQMDQTKEKAPFLASYVPKATAILEDVIADVAKESGMTETEARTILEGAPEIIESIERESLTRFNLPGGIVIEPVAYGTLAAENSAWDAKKNSLELAFRMDESYHNHLANVTPTIVTDVTVTKADINRIFDVESPQPTQLIHGTNPFRIQGKKLFPKAVYLRNELGQRFDCEVITEDPDGHTYEARSNELLEPGDYKLIVETDAGDPDGILQYPTKNVKYLKVEPVGPKIKRVIMQGYESTPDSMEFTLDTPVTLEGSGLTLEDGDKLTLELRENGVCIESGNLLPKVTSSTANRIELSGLVIDGQMRPDGEYWNAETFFVYEHDGVRIEHRVSFHE